MKTVGITLGEEGWGRIMRVDRSKPLQETILGLQRVIYSTYINDTLEFIIIELGLQWATYSGHSVFRNLFGGGTFFSFQGG